MKAKLLPVLLLVSMGSCVPNETPVRILDSYPLEGAGTPGKCTLADIRQYNGSLDISVRSRYLIAFKLASEIEDSSAFGGTGEFVGNDHRNDFEANTMVMSYTSTPRMTFPTENLPIHIVVHQSEDDTDMLVDLIGPQAFTVLADNLAVGDSADVVVSFHLRGALLSGQAMSTNTVTFPIRVYNGGTTTCGGGDRPALNGPCGEIGGQDGYPYFCCSTAPMADGCK